MRIEYLLIAFLIFPSCQSAREDQPILLSRDFEFTEGPAAAPNGDVYFTDQPNDRIYRWDAATNEISLYMEPAGRANGLQFDREGRLLAAADEQFELWAIDRDKQVEVLLDGYQGKAFNGPNDIWVHPGGAIYFTDPYYQRPYWDRKTGDLDKQQVFRYDPQTGDLQVVEPGLEQPNGIIGTPDGKLLFVADIGEGKTFRYRIDEQGMLRDKKLFHEMGSDGMTLDEKGRLYLTGDGVTILNPDGTLVRHIAVPESWTANVTFGGKNHDQLFITASQGVYLLPMEVRGTHP